MDLEKMYQTNDAFRGYVDRYCVKHEIDAKTAFTHAMVKSIAEYYKDAEKVKMSVTEVSAGCGSAKEIDDALF